MHADNETVTACITPQSFFTNLVLPAHYPQGRTRTDTISGLHAGGPPPGEVIAIATHCASCDVCVVDQDHHSVLLG